MRPSDKQMSSPINVLIIGDSDDDALLLVRELRRGGYAPAFERVDTPESMQASLDKQKWEVIIADYTLPGFSAFDALGLMKARKMDLPFIVVSGTVTDDAAVAVMKSGAHDYITRDNLQRLVPAIARELKEAEVREERRRAEEALKKSETRYRNLVEDAAAGVALLDAKGRFVYLNNTLCRMMGSEAEEIFGRSLAGFLYPDDRERVRSYFTRAFMQPRDKAELEFRVVRKDGGIVHLYSSPTPLCYRDRISGFSAIIVDITELRRAEEEIKKLARFPSENPNPVLRVAREGTILYANQASLPLLKAWDCRVGQLLPEYWHQCILGVLRSGSNIETEVECGERSLSLTVAPVAGADYVNLYGLDITERRRAEKRAREAETMRELDRVRAGLLANVSHELRTPLASIKGFISTLLREDTRWSEEEQRDFLQTADQEADRLTRLINDLLDMSRLDAGALKLKRGNHLVSEILDSVSSRLAGLAEGHQLKMAVPLMLPMVCADEMRIGQVMANLVENAAKYSSEGTEITVGARLDGGNVIIEVADRGEGIPAEILTKVFDRFYQSDRIVSGQKNGTGLGLSICRGIIEAHGGRIWAESDVGAGSRFSFSLPLSTGEEQDD